MKKLLDKTKEESTEELAPAGSLVEVPPSDGEVPETAVLRDRHLSVFGEWLRRKRTEKRLTLSRLAELSGLHISTLNQWELGDIPRQPAKIGQLAAALEEEPGTLLEVLADAEKAEERSRKRRRQLLQ